MEKINFPQLKKLLPALKKNVLLKNYTTFKIGGKAKYFFVAKSTEDLIRAIFLAKKYNLPFFALGGGSNLLVSDKGFKGLVIKMKNEKLKIKIDNEKLKIFAEAGILLGKLIKISGKLGFSGLEWAAGIPGALGGAICGNAGAFGLSMADIVKSVEVLEIIGNKNQNAKFKNQNDKSKFKIRKLKNRECNFGYRSSVFKQNKSLIILSAILQLKKGNKNAIQKKIKEYLNYKKETHPLNYPSAGSVFKNPKGFSAGELIEKCGLKGKKIGNAKISEKHANFIVNLGKARAEDVKKLINLIRKEVKKKFGVVLKEEIQYLGL